MVRLCTNEYNKKSELNSYFKNYPFELSSFQKYAIEAIITGNHILITAHTGSGKTLPAEFAIQHLVKKGKKVIYTSPIKALSNQKFHEFTNKYPDISFGILTGDIKFNPEADVLIMTTEILRNTLFQNKMLDEGSVEKDKISLQFEMDIMNELGCVVFDEIHYINDADRGKVWEETIMMLPNHIQMVMLSATIDKPEHFAQWIEKTKYNREKEVYLAPTDHRVVPLKHYSYIAVPPGSYKNIKDKDIAQSMYSLTQKPVILKEKNTSFNEETYYRLKKVLSYISKNRIYTKRSFVLNNLVRYLNEKNMLPAICFVFSRKNVEICAKEIGISLFDSESTIPATIAKECQQILMKLPNYKEYLNLPEYVFMTSLLKKGIAIHHSGIMPILREMVELLFAKGYIKLLFATETFAVGINMPTKTVIFSSFEKFDGSNMRLLLPHEYTQMAGRAGRRGIDTIGHVIHCNNLFDMPYANEYKMLLNGNPQSLTSKFKVSYNLILNLYAITSGTTENFSKFTTKSMIQGDIDNEIKEWSQKIHDLEELILKKQDAIQYLKTPMEELIKYKDISENLSLYSNKQRKKFMREMNNIKSFHKTFDADLSCLDEINNLQKDIAKCRRTLDYSKQYLNKTVDDIIEILKNNNFINPENTLTTKGLIATTIQEVHPLAFSDILEKTNYFHDLSPSDIVGVFSCFTNISVMQDIRLSIPPKDNDLVYEVIKQLNEQYNHYEDLEYGIQLDTGSDYTMNYDIVTYAMEWCESTTENDCKKILQRINLEKGIFLGEFIKAILKINNIANEFAKFCEMIGDVELLNKMTNISTLTLKFVATNQSLYI